LIKKALIILVGMIICLFAVLLIRPSRYEDHLLQVADGNIVYKRAGSGEIIILAHGFASDDYQWELLGWVDDFARSYQVITYDARGHGDSTKPPDGNSYGVRLAEDLAILIDELEVEGVHIIGHSMGGLTALKLASMYPKKVQSITLLGMGWLESGSTADNLFKPLAGGGYTGILEDLLPALLEIWPTLSDLAITSYEMKNIEVPITVIIGTEDQFYAPTIPRLIEIRPDIKVVEVEDRGHNDLLWWPELKPSIFAILASVKGQSRVAP
jgi:pimeloyl-ACP methyl ester carboxylesterase